jgi:LysM repeat protein
MKTFYRHTVAPTTRVSAALSREEPFAVEARNQGIGRVIFVVLLLHAVVLGGLAALKWGSGEGTVEVGGASAPAVVPGRPGAVADGGLGPRQISGQRIVVDHPDMPGYKRYRVGPGEELVEVVRQFQASVAEVEKLNNLKPGDPLYPGQWLTIPDHASRTGTPGGGGTDGPVKAVVIAPGKASAAAKPVAEVAAAERGPEPPSERRPEGKTYKVARGDTAYSIARRHGVEWQELLRVNGLKDPRQLRADQVIRIP